MRKSPFVQRVGGVLSADIAVPDHERELDFYSKILTTGDHPLWRDDLMNNLGSPVIGLGARTPEYENLPLQWMPHFQVADVAASAASTLNMGGQELMHSRSDEGQSQWAVLVDPFGAAFGVIPVVPKESDSAGQNESQGTIAWLSLNTPNAQASRDFYQDVVGWSTGSREELAISFEMQIDGEYTAAEICQQNEGDDIPSVWLIHLPVDDLAESLRRVRENGGQVMKECTQSQYAVIRDPVGVFLALTSG